MCPQQLLGSAARCTLIAISFWLAACKSTPPPPPPPPPVAKKPTGLFEWNGEGKAITSIQINVDEQKAYLYHGEAQVGWTYVATGITSFPTPTGQFKVLEKIQDKVSNLYGKGFDATGKLVNSDFKVGRDLLPPGGTFEPAKMTYFMRLTGDGVGMHIGPIPKPGRRASHGCIRLPSKFAGTLFKHTAVGTPVTITGKGPDYKTYLKEAEKKAKENAAKLAAAKKKAEEAAAAAADAVALPPGDPNGPIEEVKPAVPPTNGAPSPGPASSQGVPGPSAPVPVSPTPVQTVPSAPVSPPSSAN